LRNCVPGTKSTPPPRQMFSLRHFHPPKDWLRARVTTTSLRAPSNG